MKTTKDIAEMFMDEIERVSKGEVRKEVILGLEKCTNGLIKLARLEMDFAWKNWETQKPSVPWIATSVASQAAVVAPKQRPVANLGHNGEDSEDAEDLRQQIKSCQEDMRTATPTLKKILTDKIAKLQQQLELLRSS